MNLSRDSAFLNRIINDPSVFPFVSFGRKYPMDVNVVFRDRRNMFLTNEHGGFLFLFKGDGTYEVHTQFLPEGRGRMAMEAAKEASAFMFATVGCKLLTTYVENSNRRTRIFAIKAGFRKVGEVELNGFQFDEFHCTREEWGRTCQ